MLKRRAKYRYAGRVLEEAEQQVRDGRRQERAVDHVEDAAESGEQLAAVLHVGVALHEALEQVAGLSDAADDGAEDRALPPGQLKVLARVGADERRERRADNGGRQQPEQQAFPR